MTKAKTQAKTQANAQTAPNTPILAPPPTGDWWDETQWSVLVSLLDAVLAPVVAKGDARIEQQRANKAAPTDGLQFNRTTFKQLPKAELDKSIAGARAGVLSPPEAADVTDYLADRASDNPKFLMGVRRTVSGVSPGTRKELGQLLTLLSGRAGALALTGYCVPVQKQPIHIREKILQNWSNSWLPIIRIAARSFQALAQTSWLMSSPMFRQITGFRDIPPNWKAGPGFDYNFLQFGKNDSANGKLETIETDVVIVGSGCGGAVSAKILASAGHRVVVVEKGYHYPQTQLPMPQNEGARLLFENNGVLASTDPGINVAAGACWGGGGTINWSVSLRTPDRVRQEWAPKDQPGMSFLTSPEFDASMDRVCDFMGVNSVIEDTPASATTDEVAKVDDEQSHRGRVILDSAVKLGFKADTLLQNSKGGKPHDDGYCHLGCATAEKQGTSVSWLPAAANAGAQFIEGFHVERVLFEGDDGTTEGAATKSIPHSTSASGAKAIGVVGTWTSRDANGGVAGDERTKTRVVIKAKKVVVSAGSLWSPVVLKKSGLQNPQIGKNLHLHPCNFVTAYFDEETKPMDKGIITSICTSFEDLDGKYHGPRLESTCMVPYAILTNMPWFNSLDFKLAAMRYPHMDGFIALIRDRDSGRVFPDPTTGQPVVDYHPSALDREHGVEGAIGIARLCYAAGANEIRAFVAHTKPFIRANKGQSDNTKDDAVFEAWLKDVRKAALSSSPLWGGWNVATAFISAHQMGTCRMGDDEGKASVVNPRGQVWGTRDLYVADASVFPSASGVNPMVTTMSFADHIANGLAKELSGN
ncbi:long chain fatty alcohol oxidase [Sporothrix schenckii 1099-18]|uniref:long-chain-alcohol oxidase n=2 Tax=Sporothrix schenckii TaxID=29908 RepID=U7PU05_SPOS1|nr:long chain fatty alcohol oxidase [Sporothrix schenckii 1099-18]ERS99077.1 hypothetical protein HMPREF1624_04272 [Sporothrix schenckii ATCC 58251]KJR83268.1 long chain fatty alcohol oxidase [Sporothrix schenckii 1099-18]